MDLYESLTNYLSISEIELLKESLKQEDKHAALLNIDKMDDEIFLSIYPNCTPHPLVKHAYLYDKKEYDLGKSIYHELGCFYLQEPSAMSIASLLNPKEDDLVLDLCAAPGGKSIGASLLMNNKGLIISNDLSYQRANLIVDNIERLGRGNLIVTSLDFSNIAHKLKNCFDKIILDAPCSGSGMFRKDERLEKDWSINKVKANAEIQKKLIIMCYQMLKMGGILSYSTCSFSYEEDEEIIKYLLEQTDAELINIDCPFLYQNKEKIGYHFFPFMFPGEGHYLCLIKKPGNPIIRKKKDIKIEPKLKYIYAPEDYKYLFKHGDYHYLANELFDIKDLTVVRYGVRVGEINDKYVKYQLHYARFINDYPQILELDDEEVIKYISGESFRIKKNIQGITLLRYHHINIDLVKIDQGLIKNNYPKYLRKKLMIG